MPTLIDTTEFTSTGTALRAFSIVRVLPVRITDVGEHFSRMPLPKPEQADVIITIELTWIQDKGQMG